MSSFSQELHELIIDQLATNNASLRACSLVCRAFLPRSRFHLFRTLHISDNSPSKPPSSIGQFVHELEVTDCPLDKVQFDLPHLSSLAMHHQWFTQDPAIPELMKQTVRNLTLFNVHFTSTQHFKALVSSFSSLETLSLSHVQFSSSDEKEQPASSATQLPTSLRTVNFPTSSGSSAAPVLLDWLVHLDADVKVENLHAEWLDSPEQLISLSQFLSTRGQHIKSLSLSLHPYASEELTSEVIKHQFFPTCNTQLNLSSLQSLRFPDLVIGFSAEATSNINSQLIHIIRHLRSPKPTSSTSPNPSSPHHTHASNPASPLELSMEVRIAGLRELGTDDSVEFDWEEMAALVGNGIVDRAGGVNMKMLLSCDELDDLSNEEKQHWRDGTEKYIERKMIPGGREGSSMSLTFDWEDESVGGK